MRLFFMSIIIGLTIVSSAYAQDNSKKDVFLSSAIKIGNLSYVRYLVISRGKDVNSVVVGPSSMKAMHLAAKESKLEMIKLLLSLGADINVRDGDGKTPLMYAVDVYPGMDVINFLIKNGADIELVDERGRTAASYASSEIYLQNQWKLSYKNRVTLPYSLNYLVDQRTRGRRLASAIRLGNIASVRYQIVDEGKDINKTVVDDKGMKAIHLAVVESTPEMVKLLLSLGADANAQDENGSTPLMYLDKDRTVIPEWDKIFNILIDNGATDENNRKSIDTELRMSLWRADEAAVRDQIIDKAKNINTTVVGYDGMKAIHLATDMDLGVLEVYQEPKSFLEELVELYRSIHTELDGPGSGTSVKDEQLPKTTMLELVLSLGADVNVRDAKGNTPLMLCAKRRAHKIDVFEKIISFLLENGADIHLKNTKGETAKDIARLNGNGVVLQLLADADKYVNINTKVDAKLNNAIRRRDIVALKHQIVDEGKNLNTTLVAFGGMRAIHIAAMESTPEILELLLSFGADVDVQNEHGYTPLMYATINERDENVQLLINKGADVNIANKMGFDSKYFAKVSCNNYIYNILLNKGYDDSAVFSKMDAKLNRAIIKGDLAFVRAQIVDKGKDINTTVVGAGGIKAIHLAAMKSTPAMIELLLSLGADINSQSNQNAYTPLMYATIVAANYDNTLMLLNKGADKYLKNKEGYAVQDYQSSGDIRDLLNGSFEESLFNSRLGLFIEQNDIDSVRRQIVDEGVDINTTVVGAGGIKAIHLAAMKSTPAMIELLLSLGADANSRSSDGRTPLMFAVSRNGVNTALKIALEWPESIQTRTGVRNTDGKMRFMYLVEHVHTDDMRIIKLLLDNGANLDVESYSGDNFKTLIPRDFRDQFNFDTGDTLTNNSVANQSKKVKYPDSLAHQIKPSKDSLNNVLIRISTYFGLTVADLDSGLELVLSRLLSSNLSFDESMLDLLFDDEAKEGLYNYVSSNSKSDIAKSFLVLVGAIAMADHGLGVISLSRSNITRIVDNFTGLIISTNFGKAELGKNSEELCDKSLSALPEELKRINNVDVNKITRGIKYIVKL